MASDLNPISHSMYPATGLIKKDERELIPRSVSVTTLALLPIIYFAPALLAGYSVISSDGAKDFLSGHILIGKMIAAGQAPIWNPYIFGGAPLLGSGHPGAFYPPNWIFAILSPVTSINLLIIATFYLALIGSYLYGRKIGMTRLGGMFAGIAFAFGGFMITHIGNTPVISAVAWAPWIFLAIEHLFEKVSWRWITLGAIFIGMQFFAGAPEVGIYTVLIGASYLYFSWAFREGGESGRRLLRGAAAMFVCGILLSMIQLLPVRELFYLGKLTNISYEIFSASSFAPGRLLTFITPLFVGSDSATAVKSASDGMAPIVEVYGYLGFLAVLLVLFALFAKHANRLVWFWTVIAVFSLLTAFGKHLPFGLNILLYQTPWAGFFRNPANHLYEFTFGISLIAGLGLSFLERTEVKEVKRPLAQSSIVFIVIIAVAAIYYRFGGNYISLELTHYEKSNLFTGYEILTTISIATLSLIALWLSARNRNLMGAAVVVTILFVDLAIFGLFKSWGGRESRVDFNARLQDPPSVQFIKSREPDLNAFRIISHSLSSEFRSSENLNLPNHSIARGLQSLNGVEDMRPSRSMAIAGDIGADGLVTDLNIFNPEQQGLNLFNVKYLLLDRREKAGQRKTIEIEGFRFNEEKIYINLARGAHVDIPTPGIMASELAIISTMAGSVLTVDDTPVAQLKFHTKDGRVLRQEILVGRDTGEWCYDSDDILPDIKHRRPPIAESSPAVGFSAHQYLARVPFDRSEIERIEIDYLLPNANLMISRISLHDAAYNASTPISSIDLITGRWRELAKFEPVTVYENPNYAPRAWFVKRAVIAPSLDVLQSVKNGALPDGTPFKPTETALFDREDFGVHENTYLTISDPVDANVKISRYEPNQIELQTRNARPGFLVLSEIYFRGWEAWVDGKRTPVERVNHALRGIGVPAGDHRVDFVFRPPAVRNGAFYTLLGLLILLAGAVVSRFGTDRLRSSIRSTTLKSWIPSGAAIPPRLRAFAKQARISIPSRARYLISAKSLTIIAILGALCYFYLIIRHAAFAVGGCDSTGYASLARLILQNQIVRPITELTQFSLPNDFNQVFIPLAYLQGKNPAVMVPVYPIGLPLHLAIAALIFGWDIGPFLIGPLTTTMSLILIYLVGLEFGLSRKLSVAAAAMLAVSPTVIFMGVQPMSDTPAMCWALASILGSLRSRKNAAWAILAGFTFGVAFLIRPTNALLLLPILFALRLSPRALLYFGLGGLPVAIVFFIYNQIAFGNPFLTGYVHYRIFDNIKLSFFTPRFTYYTYWLAVTMSPLLLLGWFGVLMTREIRWRQRGLLFTWFGVFLVFYCFYFDYEIWWYTRFLLPGLPAVIIGSLLTAQAIAERMSKSVGAMNRAKVSWLPATALLAATIGSAIYHIKLFDLFNVGPNTIIHKESCLWADQIVPKQTLMISMEMSGALRFYTDRKIFRYDAIYPNQWPVLKKQITEKGYGFYALLMPHEIDLAQKNMPGKWSYLSTYKYYFSLWKFEPEP